jgi:hypothetical protein
MIRRWVVIVVLAAASVFGAQEPQKAPPGSLTVEEVVHLSKAGMSDDVIITRVKRDAKPFDLNADEIVELKRSGVSEMVIRYLIDPSLPYSVPPPIPATPAPSVSPPPATTTPKVPSDPLALKVPSEPGIYYLTIEQEIMPLDLKPVVPSKQPGKIPSMLSGGLVKGHLIGSVIGAVAKTRVADHNATFFVRLGEKATIDDFALLRLETIESRRNLDFGSKPGKPVFPVKSVMPFESKEVIPGLFRLAVTLSHRGEYLFFILGSGDDKKGLLGKGYDLGVD